METKQETGNLPEKKFSTGAISATVWLNEGQAKTGEKTTFRTVSLQRRYKDKNDEWQTANSLRINDLPKAALVLNKAYEFLVLKEQGSSVGEEEKEVEEEMVI